MAFAGVRWPRWAPPLFFILLALSLVQLYQSAPRKYIIRPKPVELISDAAILTRKSMPSSLNADERCIRYSVLLNMSHAGWNQFNIIENAYSSNEKLNEAYRHIDIETLRDLLIEAIEEFEKRRIADRAWPEIFDCLKMVYGSMDGKAKLFLSDPVRTKSLRQYDSIVSQPYTWLLKRDRPHPELRENQLTDQIKSFALELLGNSKKDFDIMFPVENNDVKQVESSSSVSTEAASLAPPKSEPMTLNFDKKPNQQIEKPFDGGQAESLSSVTATPISTSPVSAGKVAPIDHSDMVIGDATRKINEPMEEAQMNENSEEDILGALTAGAHLVYESFGEGAALIARCEHYAKLFTIPPEHLTLELIEQMAEEGSRIDSAGEIDHQSHKHMLMGDKFTRARFMQVVGAFEKDEIGDDTWVELMDCLIEWEDDDKDVREFVNQPILKEVYDRMLAHIDELIRQQDQLKNQQTGTQIEAPSDGSQAESPSSVTATPIATAPISAGKAVPIDHSNIVAGEATRKRNEPMNKFGEDASLVARSNQHAKLLTTPPEYLTPELIDQLVT